jgi:hypothetical protein
MFIGGYVHCMVNYLVTTDSTRHIEHRHIMDPLHFFFIPGLPRTNISYNVISEVSIFQPSGSSAAVKFCKSECRIPVPVCDNEQQDQDSSQP